MAKGWKRAVELVLGRSGLTKLRTWANGPSAAVLAYHNVVPDSERAVGDLSLHLSQSDFARQLDFLLEVGIPVSLEDLLESPHEPERGDRRLRFAITFDDAYRGTMTAGVEEIQRRSIPATVFVPTALLGGHGFWWDLVAPDDPAIADEVRKTALLEHGGQIARVLSWATSQGIKVRSLPEHAMPVTESELLRPDVFDGVMFGCHTRSHPNLTTLSEEEIRQELGDSRAWLLHKTPRYVDWLTYPYGLYNPSVEQVAQEVFVGALRVDGGPAVVGGQLRSTPAAVRRINVPRGLTLEGLALRLAGLVG